MNAHHDNWDDHWDRYAAAGSINPAQRMRHALIANILQQSPLPARLLDIGSGQGDMLLKLRDLLPNARLLGFELSESGVRISRQKVPDAEFVVADLFQPPSEVAAYRGWATHATCSEVLEHVDSPVEFLRVCRPFLAPDARLVVTVPGGPMSAFDRHIGHRQHFTRTSLRKVVESAGFEVEAVYASGFPFFNLYRCVVIARGERLVSDVDTRNTGCASRLANLVMKAFDRAFFWNLRSFPLGWQMVAVARKRGD